MAEENNIEDNHPHQLLRDQVHVLSRDINESVKVLKDILGSFQQLEQTAKENAQASNKLSQSFARLRLEPGDADLMQSLYISAVNIDAKYANSLKAVNEAMAPLIHLSDHDIPATLRLEAQVTEARKNYETSTEKLRNRKKKAGSKASCKLDQEEQLLKNQFDLVTVLFANSAKDLLGNIQRNVLMATIGYCQSKVEFAQEAIKIIDEIQPRIEKYKDTQFQEKETRQGKDMKAGYLYARVRGKWKRRWVSVMNGYLLYYKNWKDTNPITSLDLMLCSVRIPRVAGGTIARDHCFEVLSHNGKGLVFSAQDSQDLHYWVGIIQNAIQDQLDSNEVEEANSPRGNELYHLVEVPGNHLCADCLKSNPEWTSINFGILICIDCGGVHRGLGSHISKVHSLKLDTWSPELLLVMQSIGNQKANDLLEANLPQDQKLVPNTSREARIEFIAQKYVHKKFIGNINIEPEDIFESQSQQAIVHGLFQLLVSGGDVNWCNADKETLLHLCVKHDALGGIELLHLWEANLEQRDKEGRTPLQLSSMLDDVECTRLLLAHNASTEGIVLNDFIGSRVYALLSEGGSTTTSHSDMATPRRNKMTEEVREIRELFENLSPRKKPKRKIMTSNRPVRKQNPEPDSNRKKKSGSFAKGISIIPPEKPEKQEKSEKLEKPQLTRQKSSSMPSFLITEVGPTSESASHPEEIPSSLPFTLSRFEEGETCPVPVPPLVIASPHKRAVSQGSSERDRVLELNLSPRTHDSNHNTRTGHKGRRGSTTKTTPTTPTLGTATRHARALSEDKRGTFEEEPDFKKIPKKKKKSSLLPPLWFLSRIQGPLLWDGRRRVVEPVFLLQNPLYRQIIKLCMNQYPLSMVRTLLTKDQYTFPKGHTPLLGSTMT